MNSLKLQIDLLRINTTNTVLIIHDDQNCSYYSSPIFSPASCCKKVSIRTEYIYHIGYQEDNFKNQYDEPNQHLTTVSKTIKIRQFSNRTDKSGNHETCTKLSTSNHIPCRINTMHVPPGPLNQLMQLKTDNASTLYCTDQIGQHPK